MVALGGHSGPAAQRGSSSDKAGVATARKGREQAWRDWRALEVVAVEEYVDHAHISNLEWLNRLNKKIQTVMDTNVELQEQLADQELLVRELQIEHAARLKEWKELEAELVKGKKQHAKVEAQHQEVHEQRISEERRLRDKDVALHDKLVSLTREKVRLEDLRRDEHQQMVKHEEILGKLQREMMALKLRKAEMDTGESDAASMLSMSVHSSAGMRPVAHPELARLPARSPTIPEGSLDEELMAAGGPFSSSASLRLARIALHEVPPDALSNQAMTIVIRPPSTTRDGRPARRL